LCHYARYHSRCKEGVIMKYSMQSISNSNEEFNSDLFELKGAVK